MPQSNGLPLRIIARKDLAISIHNSGVDTSWLVRDPLTQKYFIIKHEHYEFWKLLDGTRSLEESIELMRQAFPTRKWDTQALLVILADFRLKGLTYVSGLSQGQRNNSSQTKPLLNYVQQLNPLFIKFPAINARRLITIVYQLVSFIFHPLMQIMLSFVCMLMLVQVYCVHEELLQEFHIRINQPGLEDVWAFLLALSCCKVAHEFAHAICSRRLGVDAQQIGFALMFFTPSLYCDVGDAWSLKNRWDRIRISLAGIYAELIIGCLAYLIWSLTEAGMLHVMAFYVIFTTFLSTLFINLNPLIKTDGYYVFQDLIGQTSLKEKAERTLCHYCYSIFTAKTALQTFHLPARSHLWYIVYSICTEVYGLLIIFSITGMIAGALSGWNLAYLAKILLVQNLFSMIMKWMTLMRKEHVLQKQSASTNGRFVLTLALVVMLSSGVFLVPIPDYSLASCLVSNKVVEEIRPQTEGIITQNHVQPGGEIHPQEVILKTVNAELIQQLIKTQAKLHQQHIQTLAYEKTAVPDQVKLSLETEQELVNEFGYLKAQVQKLTCVSNSIGVLQVPADDQNSRWQNDLATSKSYATATLNPGAAASVQTPSIRIVKPGYWQATMLVNEEQKKGLRGIPKVDVFLDADFNQTIKARVVHISNSPIADPVQLSPQWEQILNKEQLLAFNRQERPVYYPVTIEWEGQNQRLLADLHGRVIIPLTSKTLFQILLEMFYQIMAK